MLSNTIVAYIKASIPNRETASLLLRLLRDYVAGNLGGAGTAENITYDNSGSGLAATNVQEAIDELAAGSPSLTKYERVFNNTSDWTLNGAYYEFTISAAVHSKGLNPTVQIFETISSINYTLLTSIFVDTLGNVTILVTSTPNNRFNGKIIIQ